MTQPKQIETLPPIEEVRGEIPRSPRTGEPRRPLVLLIAAILLYLAVAAVGVSYAFHWWAAVHPDSYPTSARLIDWVSPEPGKWLSLTLETALAAGTVLVGGAAGVTGFQAWNGWSWSRWAGPIAVVLAGAYVALTNDWAYLAVGLATLGTALLYLPPVSRYFREFKQVRSEQPTPYRRPAEIFYGRLPRYR